MADQEFLASFGVEIDETGVLRLQEALTKNRALRMIWPRLSTAPRKP